MTYRGNHAKNTIETALRQHQETVDETARAVRASASRVDKLTDQIGQAVERAAGLIARLDVQGGGKTGQDLRTLLADRDRVRHDTKDNLASARAAAEQAGARARQSQQVLDQAQGARDHAHAKASETLDSSPEWTRAQATLENLRQRKDLLEERLAQAIGDVQEKGEGYKNPLFVYLMDRRFGEENAIRGGVLTRWMDSWVASLVDYRRQVVNFRKLRALPGLLENARNSTQQEIDTLVEQHAQATGLAWEQWPGSQELEAALARSQEQAETHEQDHERWLQKVDDLEGHLAAFAEGDDPYSRKARETVADLLQRAGKDADQLVAATDSQEDDQALSQIRKLQKELGEAQKQASQDLERHRQANAKLEEVKRFRKKFQDARLTSSSRKFSRMDNDDLLAALLVANALDDVFSSMRKHSSVDTPRPSSDVWRSSSSSSSSSGGFGSGGSLGGGGFGGGGSFGGGGFSTGGGF